MNDRAPEGPESIGGALCLDFANETGEFKGAAPADRYRRLVEWARASHALTPGQAAVLLKAGARNPRRAKEIGRRAVDLAEALRSLFTALAEGRAAPGPATAILDREIQVSHRHARLVPGDDRFAWVWDDDTALDRPLWPVTRSAGELLVSDRLLQIKPCDCPTCPWLFLDTTKNARRRWCEMKTCGNRAKARRHRERQRQV